jgi:hypothetical protein
MESIITQHDKDFTILYDPDYGHEWPDSWNIEVVNWLLAQLEE